MEKLIYYTGSIVIFVGQVMLGLVFLAIICISIYYIWDRGIKKAMFYSNNENRWFFNFLCMYKEKISKHRKKIEEFINNLD